MSDHFQWRTSAYGQRFFELERPFLDASLRQVIGPTVLQIGRHLPPSILDDFDLPNLLKTQSSMLLSDAGDTIDAVDNNVFADPAFLPFEPEVFSTIVLPHVLERHALPHQVLREVYRTLMPEGHLILTGLNPYSLIGLQRWLRPKAVCPGKYYSQSRVVDWLRLLGFEVVSQANFHFAPASRSKRLRKNFQFLESVGDRWLPMSGGGYMISAKKRDPGSTLVGRLEIQQRKRKLVAAAAAKAYKKG